MSRTLPSGRWLTRLPPVRPLEQNSNGGWPQASPRPGHVHPVGKLGTASYPKGPASGAPQRRAAGRLEPKWLRSCALSLSLCLSRSLSIAKFSSLEGCGAAVAEGAAAAAMKTQEQHRFSGRLPRRGKGRDGSRGGGGGTFGGPRLPSAFRSSGEPSCSTCPRKLKDAPSGCSFLRRQSLDLQCSTAGRIWNRFFAAVVRVCILNSRPSKHSGIGYLERLDPCSPRAEALGPCIGSSRNAPPSLSLSTLRPWRRVVPPGSGQKPQRRQWGSEEPTIQLETGLHCSGHQFTDVLGSLALMLLLCCEDKYAAGARGELLLWVTPSGTRPCPPPCASGLACQPEILKCKVLSVQSFGRNHQRLHLLQNTAGQVSEP